MKSMRPKKLKWLARFGSPNSTGVSRTLSPKLRLWLVYLCLVPVVAWCSAAPTEAQTPLRELLQPLGFKIAYESYADGNSDILVMNGDGSNPVNLTQTPTEQEHYPQVSRDGTKVCFVSDVGEGRDTVRCVYVMDIDGSNRKKVADHTREPFWSPDGKVIGFLPQEFAKFDVIDFSTKGMSFYDLATGKITPHVNSANLHHLYHPSWSANGKWIVATVHAGMGYDHTILLIEAHGNKIINLKIPGCRPCFSPDGKQVAWGADDHELAAAPINLEADQPAVGAWTVHLKDEQNKIYHVNWSPDSRFLAFSRGPDSGGDPTKPGTHQAAAEIHGVYAKGWNICVVKADRAANLNLDQATEADFLLLTTNGFSNKEPAWFRPRH
jgi:dipeptidyl aminopeptidase/acylaminoacyl peptidase